MVFGTTILKQQILYLSQRSISYWFLSQDRWVLSLESRTAKEQEINIVHRLTEQIKERMKMKKKCWTVGTWLTLNVQSFLFLIAHDIIFRISLIEKKNTCNVASWGCSLLHDSSSLMAYLNSLRLFPSSWQFFSYGLSLVTISLQIKNYIFIICNFLEPPLVYRSRIIFLLSYSIAHFLYWFLYFIIFTVL